MQGCNDCSFDYDGNLWVTAPAGDIAPKPYRRSSEVITIYLINYTPAPRRGRGVYCFTSVLPSVQDIFVTIFSVTVDGRNLVFGHKHHIGIPYCG